MARGNLNVIGLFNILEDITPQLGGELDCNEHTVGSAEHNNGNSGTAKTIDWRLGNHQVIAMTGNCTFTFIAPTKPCMLSLRIYNSGAGYTRVFPTIKWPGGTIPTWTTANAATDVLSLYCDASSFYYGQVALDCK